MLRIELYVLRQFVNPESSYGDKKQYGKHLQIQKLYGKPHIEEIIKREILPYCGKLIITSKLGSNFIHQLS